MKNADMPAMPTGVQLGDDDPQSMLYPQGIMQCAGLTKREMMAMAAMQGLCVHSGDYHKPDHLAMDALMFADAILAELERACQKT